ncbi:hypothetical protein GBO31_13985 [Aquimarina litoralis]|nr:hypothetical protein [Aquimarina litoralis]
MSFLQVQLLFDFGLVVLIWMVQLIIYPSFKYYDRNNLTKWYTVYASRISMVVIPLMVGQLIISSFKAITFFNLFNCLHILLVALVWLSTFLQFVPMHHQIANNNINDKFIIKLIKTNWLRTFLWTIVFFCTLFQIIK